MRKFMRYLRPGNPGFLGIEAIAIMILGIAVLVAYAVSRL
jgi:hypothetical protein